MLGLLACSVMRHGAILTVTQKESHPPVSPKKGFLWESMGWSLPVSQEHSMKLAADVPRGNRGSTAHLICVAVSRDREFPVSLCMQGNWRILASLAGNRRVHLVSLECGEPISGVLLYCLVCILRRTSRGAERGRRLGFPPNVCLWLFRMLGRIVPGPGL